MLTEFVVKPLQLLWGMWPPQKGRSLHRTQLCVSHVPDKFLSQTQSSGVLGKASKVTP